MPAERCAQITIDFADGSASANTVELAATNGSIALQLQSGLTAAIVSGITNLSVTTGLVSIATGTGARLSGTLTLSIGWSPPQVPSVTLRNLAPSASPATVTWPASSGPETQILMPGNPLWLTGLIGG